MPDEHPTLTANQLVGYNLARVRKALGLSQEEAAARLEPYLGKRWSKNVYSAAERSYDGGRVRQFDGDELLAMSLAFGVNVGYFLLPPRPEDRPPDAVIVSGKTEVDAPRLIIAANGYSLSPAALMRLRELPPDEQPQFPPRDSFEERYGIPPDRQGVESQ
jgi:transcriptional regulator with XRE-family HTH domain